MKFINPIYLDNASTTRFDERVLTEMLHYFTELYGNVSSNHDFGKVCKKAIDLYRKHALELIIIKTKHNYTDAKVYKFHLFNKWQQ